MALGNPFARINLKLDRDRLLTLHVYVIEPVRFYTWALLNFVR